MSVRSKRWMVRGVAAVAGGACALIVGAGSLSAHVGVDQDEIEAGSSATLGFSFSHGCEDSPTTSMSFQVPEGVNNAVPLAHAGWDIEVEREELAEPIESAHGDPITDRPAVITFTAREGFIVPSGVKDTMSLSFTAPEAPGQLFFKVIQGCEVGSNDWIDEWDGTGEEPESPAPSVMVVAATGEDATGSTAPATTTGSDAPATTVAVDDDGGDDDDGSSNGLAIAGIVLGAAGLGVGGTALVRSRKDQ